MKKIILFFFLIGNSFLSSFAQCDYKNVDLLKISGLKIILTDEDSTFNNSLKTALENNWTFSKLKFIGGYDFDKVKSTEDEFFLVFVRVYGDGYTDTWMEIIQGGKKGISNLTVLCAIRFLEDNLYKSAYMFPFILRKFQSELKYISSDHSAKSNDFYLIDPKLISVLSNKVLILKKKNIAENSSFEKLKEAYPYTIKLLGDEEYEEAIKNLEPNTCFIYGKRDDFFIYDLDTFNTIYTKHGYPASWALLDEKNIKVIADKVKSTQKK